VVEPRGHDPDVVVPQGRSRSIAFEMLFSGAPESRFPRKIGADAWFDFRFADVQGARHRAPPLAAYLPASKAGAIVFGGALLISS
jgi:hypothetical protein